MYGSEHFVVVAIQGFHLDLNNYWLSFREKIADDVFDTRMYF